MWDAFQIMPGRVVRSGRSSCSFFSLILRRDPFAACGGRCLFDLSTYVRKARLCESAWLLCSLFDLLRQYRHGYGTDALASRLPWFGCLEIQSSRALFEPIAAMATGPKYLLSCSRLSCRSSILSCVPGSSPLGSSGRSVLVGCQHNIIT